MPPVTLPGTGTVVKINGSSVGIPRPLRPLQLVAWHKGGIPTFTFAVRSPRFASGSDPYSGKTCEVIINGTTRFKGRVESVSPRRAWYITYQALGQRSDLDHFPHTDALDGGNDTSVYNASSDNQGLDYLASRAGRTVGQILTDVLTAPANAAAINAAGLGAYTSLSPPTLPAVTVSDLAALSVIPPNVARFGGEKFGQGFDAFLAEHAPNYVAFWRPSDGALRVLDVRTFTPTTFTEHSDPIDLAEWTRDITNCYTRGIARGCRVAEMAALSLSGGGLDETLFAHDGLTSAQAKAKFRAQDFRRPGFPSGQALAGTVAISGGAPSSIPVADGGYGYSAAPSVWIVGDGTGATATSSITSGVVTSITPSGGTGYTHAKAIIGSPSPANSDAGTCTCPTTTTVTITSANKAARFPASYLDWSTGRHATILLISSITSGVNAYAQRKIVSNPALTPGGTATLTLDRSLPHTNFDSYIITCDIGGASNVYTLYHIADSDVRANLATQATFPFSYRFGGGAGVTQTSTALGTVLWDPDSNGFPPYEEATTGVVVDRSAGTVLFGYPTKLTAGMEPTDVRALVPVYVASNTATSPADIAGVPQYTGTAYSIDGLQRTLTVTLRSWRDPIQLSAMQAYIADLVDSVKDAVVEGRVTYYGLYEAALYPGIAANVTGSSYSTGFESANATVVKGVLDWNAQGLPMRTTLECSNRRAHYSAEMFLQPERYGGPLDWGGTLGFGEWGLGGHNPEHEHDGGSNGTQ